MSKGKLPTWAEFKKAAVDINNKFNKTWLETEFHQTIATANMAEKWQQFERDADLYPNLKYVTVGDGRVRDKHKALHGLILPINHPLWKKILPPNDWGCRCNVVQTDEPVTTNIPSIDIKKEFNNNPVYSGKVFNETVYSNGITGKEIAQIIQQSAKWLLSATPKKNQRLIKELILKSPVKHQFKEIYKNGKGSVLEHLLIDPTADDYKEVMQTAKLFADNGHMVELMPEVKGKSFLKYRSKIYPNYELLSNPDLRIDGVYYDVKRPSAIKNIQKRVNEAYLKQKSIGVIHIENRFKISDTILKKRMDDIFSKKNASNGKPNYPLNTIYVVINGKLKKFNRPKP